VAQLKADNQAVQESLAASKREQQQQHDNRGMEQILQESEAPVNEDKYEDMSKKQIVDLITGAVETALDAQTNSLRSEFSNATTPDAGRMKAIEQTVMGVVAKLASDESRQKHEDFDAYAPAISKIMGEIPNIGFEDAYLIAKSRAAGTVQPQTQINTEKPTIPAGVQNPGGVLPNQTTLQTIADRGSSHREGGAAPVSTQPIRFKSLIQQAAERVIPDS